MKPLLNERLWRQFLANEAISYGHGGINLQQNKQNLRNNHHHRPINELKNPQLLPKNIRKKAAEEKT
jgi:hypothetical protein